jgi:hypothetical protein
VALFLGLIKGPNVDDWVQLQMDELSVKYNQAVNQNDKIYWDDLGCIFINSFWDTASWEHAKEKLQNLTWIPGNVDTFIAKFCTLANQAEYPLDDHPTITLFTSKLPFKMMEHISKTSEHLIFRVGLMWVKNSIKVIW